MSNNPTPPRIEREAEAFAQKVKETCYYPEDNWSTSEVAEAEARSGYYAGATAQHNRAAPVVKALEDRLKEWQLDYETACEGVDRINLRKERDHLPKMQYPTEPDWVTEAKQILETYKADV